jgi:hypothetical protein
LWIRIAVAAFHVACVFDGGVEIDAFALQHQASPAYADEQ